MFRERLCPFRDGSSNDIVQNDGIPFIYVNEIENNFHYSFQDKHFYVFKDITSLGITQLCNEFYNIRIIFIGDIAVSVFKK